MLSLKKTKLKTKEYAVFFEMDQTQKIYCKTMVVYGQKLI